MVYSAPGREEVREPEPRIVDPATHPREWVCFSVAAQFLGMNRRALAIWASDGHVRAEFRGRWRKIHIKEVVRFQAWLRRHANSL